MEKIDTNPTNGNVMAFTRGNVLSDKCPSRHLLKHVTSRWAVLIFLVLKDGNTYRFSEIRRTIEGVSEKMLAQTLQTLEQDNFVQRTSYPVVPPKVEYNLTPIGMQAAKHVITLVTWLEENVNDILQPNESQEKQPINRA